MRCMRIRGRWIGCVPSYGMRSAAKTSESESERRVALSSALVVLLALIVCIAANGCAPATGGNSAMAIATATPTFPQTTQGHLAMLAYRAIGPTVQHIATTYDAQGRTVSVTATIEGKVPRTPAEIGASQERVKTLCFRAQRALWTSGVPLHAATITILGPTLDDFIDVITEWYGVALLTARTAQTFSWSSLSADAAWERYDQTLLRPDYAPNQHYGAPPAGTPATS